MTSAVFGALPNGREIREVSLRSKAGATATVMEWGAVVRDMHAPRPGGGLQRVVLGLNSLDDYINHSPHMGAIAGRFANRIRDGAFRLDGQRYQLPINYLGKHSLHGGPEGFGRRAWTILDVAENYVVLALHSPAGDQGYPGAMSVLCRYTLLEPATLRMGLTVSCNAPTILNLCHHSYFNLEDGGAGDILDHRLMLAAAAYLPVDDELIPTGVVQPVAGTAFDFMQARPIRYAEAGGDQIVYDHNFCLAATRGPLRQAVWAQGPRSGVEMEMWTTEPGVQFYAGHKVAREQDGLGGRRYHAHAGFCLEAQVWPDAPNHPYFPQATLWPGEIYRHVTEYRFRLG